MNVMENVLNEKIDPALTEDNLNMLLQQAVGNDIHVQSSEVLLGGCWNRVLSLSVTGNHPDVVLKINPQEQHAGLAREFQVLEFFITQTQMPVPRPIYFDDSGAILPGTLYLMERIPGMVLHQAYAWLSHQNQEQITRQLADYVGELHQTTSSGFGGVESPTEELNPDWPATWLPVLDDIIEQIKPANLLDSGFIRRIERIRPELPKLLTIAPQSTLTHYDIWSGNVMVDLANGNVQITGFIDVSGQWADYARELSFMEVFGLATPEFYRYYEDYHPLDDDYQIRKSIY